MTERLYEKEPETLTFAAKVLSCREAEGGYAVVLDRTGVVTYNQVGSVTYEALEELVAAAMAAD